MASNLANEIAAKIASLPVEKQREVLALIEQIAARAAKAQRIVPRAKRKLKGATAQGLSVGSEELREARREMWGEYMREDEA